MVLGPTFAWAGRGVPNSMLLLLTKGTTSPPGLIQQSRLVTRLGQPLLGHGRRGGGVEGSRQGARGMGGQVGHMLHGKLGGLFHLNVEMGGGTKGGEVVWESRVSRVGKVGGLVD